VNSLGKGSEKSRKVRTVAFFRPKSRAGDIKKFEKLFHVVHVPLIETIENESEVERFRNADFRSAIVTSVTAVEILEKHRLVDKLVGKKVVAIGNKTAERLRKNGIECEIPGKFDSESVVREFRGRLEGKIALLRSDKGDPVLLEVGDAEEFRLYRIEFLHGEEQEELIKEIANGKVNFAVFSSRMMVRSFFSLCEKLGLDGREVLKSCTVIAIGPPTRRELERFGVKCEIPEEYTFEGVFRLLRGKSN